MEQLPSLQEDWEPSCPEHIVLQEKGVGGASSNSAGHSPVALGSRAPDRIVPAAASRLEGGEALDSEESPSPGTHGRSFWVLGWLETQLGQG